jgi:transcriptional regulator with XRE-family HTH domain
MVEVAMAAGIPVETLRKIESGRTPTPAFFTIAALAATLGVPLEELAGQCVEREELAVPALAA